MHVRFTIRDLLFLILLVAVALAWFVDHRRLMSELRGYGGPLTAGQGYDKCTTLTDAVQLAKGQLAQDGKREFAALLSEDRVLAAIQTAIKREDMTIDSEEKQSSASKEYWQNVVKPIYLSIVQARKWPADCSFDGFYQLTDGPITYDGLGLRLTIKTPNGKFNGSSLPILDLFFGK
jgi:hypothetical protein